MALSKKFLWVKVDRDAAPDVPKRFGVSAYPTLLTLGAKDEKVHRTSGFKEPQAFRGQLEDALRRYALYRAGKEWDDPEPRPASVCDSGSTETFAAPSDDVPSGLAFLDGKLFVAQQQLAQVDFATGQATPPVPLPPSTIDLCTDGKRLFGVDYGWTAGRPIHEIDPKTGKSLREIVTKANLKNRSMGAKGLAFRGGKLYVLDGMRGRLHEVDPKSGDVVRTIQTDARWLAGLAFDGTHFVAGSRDALYWFDPDTGKTARKVAVNYPLRSVAFRDGSYYLMEQPVFGHDKQHKRVRVWPKRTVIHKLTLNR